MAANERGPRQIALLTALLLLGTFAAGIALGAGLCRWLSAPPLPPRHGPPPQGPPLPGPFGELGLAPEQERRAREIADRHRPELEAIIRETFPRVRAVNDKMEQELRTILTPEQQLRLDELKAQLPLPGVPGGPPPPGLPGFPRHPGEHEFSPFGGPGMAPPPNGPPPAPPPMAQPAASTPAPRP